LDRIAEAPLDLVLVDVHLRESSGLSLLKRIRENALPLAVVVITGMGDEETAVAALKARADDYIVKRKAYLDRLPVTLEQPLSHYSADEARRSRHLEVLYAAADSREIAETRSHFAVHAEHIHLDVVCSEAEALFKLQSRENGANYHVILLGFQLPNLNPL